MPSWYDIVDFTRTNEDLTGILESATKINKAIDMEIDRMKSLIDNGKNDECKDPSFASTNVFVGGFSQGGAMAVYCGYHYKQTLGGIIALSGYVLDSCNYPKEIHEANQDTNLLVYHGEHDQVVPVKYSEYTFNQLQGHINMKYTKLKQLQHEVYPDEIQKVCDFVSNGGSLKDLENSARSKL